MAAVRPSSAQETGRMNMKPKTIEATAMTEDAVKGAAGKGVDAAVAGLKDGMAKAAASPQDLPR